LVGKHTGGSEKGGAKQQVAAEGHSGKIQDYVKIFFPKSRKTSRKKFLFSISNLCQRLSYRAASGKLFSPGHANPTTNPHAADFTHA
jgi:hypothetical protein